MTGFAACDLDEIAEDKLTSDNFPTNQAQLEKLITGVYAVMNDAMCDPEEVPFYVFDMASDDRLGGGSSSSKGAQCADRLMNEKTSRFEHFWDAAYKGICRANTAIEQADKITNWTSIEGKNQLVAEAYFLRAFYYTGLIQLFGRVPLITSTVVENTPCSDYEPVYKQIASDLQMAIDLFSPTKYSQGSYPYGRASKWAAEAMLARVWLFYTGFYKQSALPTNEGSVSQADVIKYLEDLIQNSGYDLVSDQRNLWPYTNQYTAKDYKYLQDNSGNVLPWVNYEGDDNKENIFALHFSNVASFSSDADPTGSGYANRIVEFFGLRKGNASSFPFVPTGYSNGPVCTTLLDDWQNDRDYANDPRMLGSICDRRVEMPNYPGDTGKEMENTFLHAKKYLGVACYDGGTLRQSWAFMEGGQDDKQLGLTQSLVFIRFADVLLMHAELTNGKAIYNGKDGMNAVRQRSGLADIPYSFDNLVKERRFELCFEGIRWNDLRRWGKVSEIEKNQDGVIIKNKDKEGKKFSWGNNPFMTRYNETKGGFFKLPESQVTLSDGVMTQNEGWGDEFNWVSLPSTY